MLIGIILKTRQNKKNYRKVINKLKNIFVRIDNRLFLGDVNLRIKQYILNMLTKNEQDAIIFHKSNNYTGFNIETIGKIKSTCILNEEIFSRY